MTAARPPARPATRVLRCAIYTRKSTEQGLEQEFNSLHNQREAAEAYVKSQAHEGWRLLPAFYDDGGVSGGSLERPALQRLLAEVRAGHVDVIVVYKVDRLTRSLADFAKLVELFDRHATSFVSVTQAFNTTSSMGRLTLNVLLSFAQFEREVTGERIRDKIAASSRLLKKASRAGQFVIHSALVSGGCRVRGQDSRSGSLFSYVDLEQRVRADHPLRTIRTLVNEALASLDGRFGEIYSEIGRPSIPPEQLLRAMLLQAFYSVRSERQLMEQLDFNLLFRWFVGLGIDDAVWDASTFSKNRDRLLDGSVAAAFLSAVLAIPRVKRLLSQDHFSVDGTLIQAWASMKSFRPKNDDTPPDPPSPPEPPAGGRNAEVDFHGQRLSNDTHRSTTDPEAKLYRKGRGREAKLSFMGHLLMENRNGLIVDGCVTEANGHAERTAALAMIEKRADRPSRITLGADKGYDAEDFVNELRSMNVTPHIARNIAGRHSAVDGRTTRHPGYGVSQRIRKRIEEGFGWGKEFGLLRRIRMRGCERVDMAFAFSAAACNLIRLPKLLAETAVA